MTNPVIQLSNNIDTDNATYATPYEALRSAITRYDAASATVEDKPAEVPFLVRVSISNLNIRKGAGTNYATIGKYTGKGVFTIMEVKAGKGSTAGWGRLKSGAGWISLDYATRI